MSSSGVALSGLVPTPPAVLRARLLTSVASTNPGYTANLPASLIEDVSSTDVGALILTDSAKVETVNSLTPYAANPFLLNQLGQIYGVPIGQETNTSVFVVFSGTPGYAVAKGFTVTDGTFQYALADGGAVGAGGTSPPLFAVATIQGSWAVPPGTVGGFVTSVPSSVTLTVTNPLAGTPGDPVGETEESYRSAVLEAGLAAAQGMARFLRTLLGNVVGVPRRLISVRMKAGSWEIICGGGDPYQVAYAIFTALFDPSTLIGSTIGITAITKANPGVVTTDLNHGLVTAQANVFISGALGMTAANGGPYTVTVITEKTFSFGVDTSGFGTYTGGGVVTPNARNVVVSISDYPDTYLIPYVNPPQQVVTMTVTWNTDSPNFVNPAAVEQLSVPALVAYVNSIYAGQPMNVFQMNAVFQAAIASILDPSLLSRLVFVVFINGVSTAPTSGTGLIVGDPESYFFAVASGITVAQG